jgi:hypothetical protein
MKLLTIIGFLLSGSFAVAMPAVNDYAQFAATVSDGTKTQTAVYELQLTAYDAQKKEFTMSVTFSHDGQSVTQTNQVPEGNLPTDAVIAQMLTNCTAFGGKAEKLTVGTAAIDTCAIPSGEGDESGTVWIGAVPFGVVKQQVTNTKSGLTNTMTLSSYRSGS